VNELRAYSDFKAAFWRELVQNAVDAGASAIKITLENRDGKCFVSFLDNGPGMDLQTLENVYFVVGETTKTGPNSIGGFGRARILTCFAHEPWQIHTNEWLCLGSGSQYEIVKADSVQKGCLISVTVALSTVEEMQSALESYLESCQLSCQVCVNGVAFKNWAYRNRSTGQLSFGKVYLNKSLARNSVLVRVNGACMFQRYTQADWQIVLEIDPERSREVLTSNRDGLSSATSAELDDLIGTIWINPLSAVRSCYQSLREDFDAPVFRVKKKSAKAGALRENPAAVDQGDDVAFDRSPEIIEPEGGHKPSYVSIYEKTGTVQGKSLAIPSRVELLKKRVAAGYVMSLESSGRTLQAAFRSFLPEKIVTTKVKLLKKWTEACTIAAEEFAELEGEEFGFRTGFVFADDDLAQCARHDDICDLLLRPVTSDGKLAYRTTSRADMAQLLAIAAHEVVHMSYSYHDERFARSLTMLLGRLLGCSKRF
jgi:hypothetical protein